jgi:hypothetical protein
MDANTAPLAERLARADNLVTESAKAGAELVVLPELFNSGYTYSPDNHTRAERMDGETASWMKETANRLGIHLAGSFMLLDEDEVYNALLLFSPDGRYWRYDKNYPWGWERGYFRDSHRITIAQTDLGDIGMMICWDSAHADLWQRYAGRVDLMLISSCPPDVSDPVIFLPDGEQITFDDMGFLAAFKGSAKTVFGEIINQQTAWMGVPTVNTVCCGNIRTKIPNSQVSLISLLPISPWLAKYLMEADQIVMAYDFVPGCKIISAQGKDLALLSQEQGEAYIVAPVTLGADKSKPEVPQPVIDLNWITYFMSDSLLPALSISVYRQGLRQAWGAQMAPIQAATRRWLGFAGFLALAAYFFGRVTGRKGSRKRDAK